MPEQFDPAWEYYQGDTEIEEILREASKVSNFDMLSNDRASFRGWNIGLRFGVGNPNRIGLRFSKPKRGLLPSRDAIQCRYCRELFNAMYTTQVYCSRECSNRHMVKYVSQRILPLLINCQYCGLSFKPENSRRKYCSLKCGTANNGSKKTVEDKRCLWCQCVFSPLRRERLFCSKRCSAVYRWSKAVVY